MSVNWRILACRRHRPDLGLVAAGLMTEAEAPTALRHLAGCPACQHKVAQWKAIARLGSRSALLDPSQFPSPTLRERWTREIRRSNHLEPTDKDGTDSSVPWSIGRVLRQPAGVLALAWLLIAFFWFSAPRITKPAASDDGLTWGQVIAVLQSPPPPLEIASPAASTSPVAPAPMRTNGPSPGPLGQNLRQSTATHGRKA